MKKHLILFAFYLISSQTFAQKPALNHSVYDLWNSIGNSNIAPSGKLIYYTLTAQEGDAKTILTTSSNHVIRQIDRGINPKLNKNESHLIVTIKPFFRESREAKIKKRKTDELPPDSLVIISTSEKSTSTNLGPVKSHKTAFNFGDYIAFVQDIKVAEKLDSAATKQNVESIKSINKASKKEPVLVFYNISSGDTVHFTKIDNYSFSYDEKYLVFNKKTTEKENANIDGLYFYDIDKKDLRKISNGKGVYKSFTFDDLSKQFAFLADKSGSKNQIKDFKLYYYHSSLDSAKIIAERNTSNIPKNWYVSGDANLNFSASGQKLYFGLAPIPAIKDTTLVDFENAKVDIWHWKDETLMTQQLVNLKREQTKSYLTVFDIKSNTLIPLQNETFNRVIQTDSGDEEWTLATSNIGRTIETQWQLYSGQDIYLISTRTGQQKLIKKDWIGNAYLSPDTKYILFYNDLDQQWFSYEIASEKEQELTKNTQVAFADELNDMPSFPASYGIAAWANDLKGIYLNDRYDIWYFSLDGNIRKNITKSFGRDNNIILRVLNIKKHVLRPKTFTIDKKDKLILTSFNEKNKENGFFEINITKNKGPQEIIQDKYSYKSIQSDKTQKHYIYTKENFNTSPNLYASNLFRNEIELLDINPQQANYNWGTAELIHWTTPKGYKAEGILYKPEDFDPMKKYPIIAYFYETSTEGLYTYQAPAPTPSRLNIPYYVSNGYLVFSPDIRYEIGHPGQSAEEYINSGMQYLATHFNFVDSTKMAIQGQSWGGYQVAHLITRTNMYAAAWTGAPVVNMTSAYGGIRWGTGMSRQFQYEKTQSRLGATLWENRDLYIENSPLFFMDRVNTPVVIMHNDNDGAVPWYQGIEMFTALRRLQKPVWLLNYNNDGHNLMERQNRKDIQIRQSQFFDHFLKGKPAAEWIELGVPATQKGINWGLNTKTE